MALRRIVRTTLTLRVTIALVAVLWTSPVDAGVRDWWFGEPWSFVQDVGGIRIGGASRMADGAVELAIECDVSGLRPITCKPQHLNSAIGVSKVLATVEGWRIAISLRTGVGETSACRPLTLRNLESGTYSIVYSGADREIHDLGTVNIP
jgi:hypothetical protein